MNDATQSIATQAARLVVESGLEYAAAKAKAARALGLRRTELPSNEQVEDEVREYLSLFCAQSQPGELAALRALALRWMDRLAAFRPHLSGAVWRGTATRVSAVRLDLYCDDPKALPIALVNHGIAYDVDGGDDESQCVFTVWERSGEMGEDVALQLVARDLDDLKGALKPDSRGRSWRGDHKALRRLLQEQP